MYSYDSGKITLHHVSTLAQTGGAKRWETLPFLTVVSAPRFSARRANGDLRRRAPLRDPASINGISKDRMWKCINWVVQIGPAGTSKWIICQLLSQFCRHPLRLFPRGSGIPEYVSQNSLKIVEPSTMMFSIQIKLLFNLTVFRGLLHFSENREIASEV